MSISSLICNYSPKESIKLNGKNTDIIVTEWLIKFSDGTRKKYQVTFYNPSHGKKNGTISKKFSAKNSDENPETTLIQINNSEGVKLLQEKADTIKLTIKQEVTTKTTHPITFEPFEEKLEIINEHCIDPNGFVDAEKNLYLNNDYVSYAVRFPDYLEIKKYLEQNINKELDMPLKDSSEEHENKNIENDNIENANNDKSLIPKPSNSESNTLKVNNRRYLPSTRCNLMILASIIFSVAVVIITNLSDSPPPVKTGWFS